MTKLLLWGAVIVGGLIFLKLFVLYLEPHVAFFPMRGEHQTPDDVGIAFDAVSLKTDDGETIHSWLLKHPHPRAEVLFFHGNGGNLSVYLGLIAEMHHRSLTVFIFDYRGYGRSSGSPSERGLYQDTRAAVDHFWEHCHAPNATVIYWGRSLGGVTASYASTLRQPDGLILESTFPDKTSLAKHYPVLGVLSFLSRYRFPTVEFLEDLSCPALVIHGDEDEIVPFPLGEKVFQELRGEKGFYRISGARHNDTHKFDPEPYWRRVVDFMEGVKSG